MYEAFSLVFIGLLNAELGHSSALFALVLSDKRTRLNVPFLSVSWRGRTLDVGFLQLSVYDWACMLINVIFSVVGTIVL